MLYRANFVGTISHPRDGMEIIVNRESTYDDSDPYVKELIERFPTHFSADNVERATAEPGEKRAVGRPRKSV